jgi:tetratricopeptide (TPR) repeat protein/predicted Ser/Thr protein kinase
MGNKCPKCDFENPDDTMYCGKCGTQLRSVRGTDPTDAGPDIRSGHPKDVGPDPRSGRPKDAGPDLRSDRPTGDIPDLTKTMETPTEELTRGSTLANRYEIIEELGKGGMGRVYRVEDTKLEQEVALKLIKPEIAKDKKTIERFRNELKLARNIRHKNVCGMFDLGEDKGAHFITMEYVRGEDLRSLIRRIGQLPIGKSISIATQICEGLAEAHRLGVVHRDLKSNNIMIDREGNVRIMDFGIARSLESKGITGAGVMIGTPEYMSPEQVEGKEVDQRSDIYSLGVILYEMVTGRVPFEGDTPFTIGMKHKGEIPQNPKELNSQISDDLNRLILRCLEKEKERRFQSAGEVRSELENIEKGIPTTERVVPQRKPLTSREITVQFNVKKLLIPALAVIALVIAAVIIWQLIPQKEAVIPPKIENSLAIISFENQTGDKTYDYLQKAIPNLLITNLEQTGNLYVATWERLDDILKQMGKKDVEVIDRDLGFQLCRREGIETIVLGSFIKAGNMFATDVKVLDVENKKLLKSASSRGEGIDSIIKTQIDELSREIYQGLGELKQDIDAVHMRIEEVTTTSMDAYNYFLRGRSDYEKFYSEDARQFLEKSIELDPTFASAYLYLALTYDELGFREARNNAYEKAKAFSEKTPEKERLFIEAFYASTIERDPDKRFRILQQIAEKYPKEKRVHYYIGFYYEGKNMLDQALEEYNKALELDPNYGYAINQCAYLYADLGQFEKAIQYLERYASLLPGDANPVDSIAEIYFRMGKLDEAILKYREALEIKPDFGSDMKIAYIYALKEDYAQALKWIDQHMDMAPSPGVEAGGLAWRGFFCYALLGRYERALDDVDSAAKIAEEIKNESFNANMDWTRAWIYYEMGMLDLARKHLKKWIDFHSPINPSYLSDYKAYESYFNGLVALKEGDIKSAEDKLEKVKTLLPELTPSWESTLKFKGDLLHGEILIAEGSSDEAIAVCRKTPPVEIPPMYTANLFFYNAPFLKDVLARAYQKKGDIDQAIAEYERLITFDLESKDRYLIHPLYHYRLAKLYQEKGLQTKAVNQYEKFLDLWKDADPGRAEVEDARKRLAGLKSH